MRAVSGPSIPSAAAGGAPGTARTHPLVPRDRQSKESRAISGHFYRNGPLRGPVCRPPGGMADRPCSVHSQPENHAASLSAPSLELIGPAFHITKRPWKAFWSGSEASTAQLASEFGRMSVSCAVGVA